MGDVTLKHSPILTNTDDVFLQEIKKKKKKYDHQVFIIFFNLLRELLFLCSLGMLFQIPGAKENVDSVPSLRATHTFTLRIPMTSFKSLK